jgi:16S rRNA (uracil1498-N3)-methyltransferase
MRLFYIDPCQFKDHVVVIKGSEARHIKNVLRLRPGDNLKLSDGSGSEYEAVIINEFPNKVVVEILQSHHVDVKPSVQIIVAQAYLKEKKMDDLVRMLCELGIATWIPFFSERSIARPSQKRLDNRSARWKRIAQEALKQCRRLESLEIKRTWLYKDVLNFAKMCEVKIIFWEDESSFLDTQLVAKPANPITKILLMLGPEGGFTSREVEMALNRDFVAASLGPRILRAETATLAACTLIQYLYGDMGKKNLDKL